MFKMQPVSRSESDVTHDQLVRTARDWLGYALNCRVVATELVTTDHEVPDAIGFKGSGKSILIECKTSRSDFQSDQAKFHRKLDLGMGNERYYLCPAGMLRPDEIPSGWGLLERVKSKGYNRGYFVRIRVKAPSRTLSSSVLMYERRLLISACARALEAVRLVKPLWYSDDLKTEPESDGEEESDE